ncbi:MAG: UDP-N-acetylmuramate dehydrogenase [Pseudomonadota bacterium]
MNMNEPARFTPEGLRGTLECDADMRRRVSWRAGGRAERLYQPHDLADLALFLRSLPDNEPRTFVGLGSNLLVRDGGVRGTVIVTHGALNALQVEADGTVYAEAGVAGAKLARFAALHNLRGAEFFAGIPGTVGGMLAMNAGCYGSETWQRVAQVRVVTRAGEVIERSPADYEVGYRSVCGKQSAQQNEWFVGAWFRFVPGDGEAARQEIKALLEKRVASQPLNMPNAGSVFRNPPGDYAARLIESCGLKGRRIGGAQVSEKHANFIVNAGGATAAEIEQLIQAVQAEVEQKTGIRLHPEVRMIGEAQ